MTARFDTIKIYGVKALGVMAMTALMACSGAAGTDATDDTSATDDSAVTDNASSAVTAVFGGSDSSGNLVKKLTLTKGMLVRMVEAAEQEGQPSLECDQENDPYCTCASIGYGPSDVNTSASGDAGTYGASGSSLTVVEGDFCALADGTETSGLGSDGEGRVASFEINQDIDVSCQSDEDSSVTVTMLAGSSGIFRNTADYMPQIFGSFVFSIPGGDENAIDCTIYLLEDGTPEYANCSDANGEEVYQSDDSNCEFEHGDDEEE